MPKEFVKDDPRINRKGRPKKGQTITDEIRKELERQTLKLGKSISKRKAIAKVLVELSLHGDLPAIRQLMTYIDGLPIEKHEITGAEGGPMHYEILIDPALRDTEYDEDNNR